MARDEEPQGNIRISPPDGGRMRALGRCVLTLVIIVTIAMVAFCFLVRGKGMQSFMANTLSDRMGIEMSIDGARIGLPYVLVIEGPVSHGFEDESRGGFKAGEMRIGLGWRTRLRVSVDRAVVRLVDTSDDTWVPAAFSRLGAVPVSRIDEISRVTESFRRKAALRVTDSTVRWISGADGGTLALALGVGFSVQPAGVPGRDMYHHSLKVYSVTHVDGTKVGDVEREWLASETARYVEVYRSGKTVPRTARDFWDPPVRRTEETDE